MGQAFGQFLAWQRHPQNDEQGCSKERDNARREQILASVVSSGLIPGRRLGIGLPGLDN